MSGAIPLDAKPPAIVTTSPTAGGGGGGSGANQQPPNGTTPTVAAPLSNGGGGVPVTPLPTYTTLPPLSSQLPPNAGSSLPSPGSVVTNITAADGSQQSGNSSAHLNGSAGGSSVPQHTTLANGTHIEPTTRAVAPSMLTIHQPANAAAVAAAAAAAINAHVQQSNTSANTHPSLGTASPVMPALTVHYNPATNPALHMADPRLSGQPPLPVGPPPLPIMLPAPMVSASAASASASLQVPAGRPLPNSNSSGSLSTVLAATSSAPLPAVVLPPQNAAPIASSASAAPAAHIPTLAPSINVYTRLEPCLNRLRDILKKVEEPPTYISQILLSMEQFTEYLYNKSPPAASGATNGTNGANGTPNAPHRQVAGSGGAAPIRDTDHIFAFNGFDPKITAALLAQQHAHEQSLAAAGVTGGSSNGGDRKAPIGKHVFETSEMWKVPETEPIYDIGITFSNKESALPEGWELLKKSMTGTPADLNKGSGAKPVYLTFRRGSPDAKQPPAKAAATAAAADKTNSTASITANSTAAASAAAVPAAAEDGLAGEALKPITSLSVIFADTQEEAPYGFKRISHTADKLDANLGAAGRSVFLCVFRGDGAPITDLGVVFHEKQKEALPSGFHEVKHTPFGNKADLNAGSDGTPVFICFRPYVTSMIQKFQFPFRDLAEEAISKCLSILSMCLYCFEQRIIVHALESFKLIQPATFVNCPHILNTFLQCICDATPCFLTYFATQTHTYLLKFLLLVYQTYLPLLDHTTILKIFEACFLARHEDKEAGVSQMMLLSLLGVIDRCKPCRCQKKKTPASTAAAAAAKKDKTAKKETSALRCHKCQLKRAIEKTNSNSIFAATIFNQISDNVTQGSPMELELGTFLRTPNPHKKLRTHIVSFTDSMYALERTKVQDEKKSKKSNISPTEKEEKVLYALVLMCCKFATETAPFKFSQELSKSETVKRKLHALTLLLLVIQKSNYLFRATTGAQFLLRRVICPTLITTCVTDVPSIFRLIIQIFLELWGSFNETLMIELGVFLDHIFLGLLESPHPTQEQKKDILELFLHILGTPASLVHLYYNFDNNSSRPWPIYERLVTAVGRLIEGDFKTNNEDAALDPLKRNALKVMVHIMRQLADWIGVPLHGPNAAASAAAYVGKDRVNEAKDSKSASFGIPQVAGSGAATAVTGAATAAAGTGGTTGRRPSWQLRLDKQRQKAKILSNCLQIAKNDSIRKMVKHMELACPELKHPSELSKLLYYGNESLKKDDVGDYISMGDEKKKNEKIDPQQENTRRFFESLRNHFIALVDFTGMTFDAAIRLYLCDCGFKLPGEAQRIDRMMSTFVKGYVHDNPGMFRNSDSGYIVAFAVIMLNTELHNPNLKVGAAGKNRMTKEQFIKNLKGVDDGRDFPKSFLNQIYDDVAANAIEWKDDIVAAKNKPTGGDPKALDAVAREKIMRHAFEVIARRSQAFLRVNAPYTQPIRYTDARGGTGIGVAMFDASWNRFYTALSTISDRTKDVDLLRICLDGLAYGSTIAIQLQTENERLAFTRQLAKITFIERNRNADMVDNNTVSAELQKRLVKSDHLRQEWYVSLATESTAHPLQACKNVLDTSYDVKQRIIYDRRQSFLRRINGEFGGELNLVDPARMFVRESLLTKMSNASQGKKPTDYHFFLFNDILLYASEGLNTKYVMHRVIHLSLCRLIDYQRPANEAKFDTFAFRIVSPQKSFMVCAKSGKEKLRWLESISTCIKQIQSQRRKFFGQTAAVEEKKDAKSDTAAATDQYAGSAPTEKHDPVFDPSVEPEGRNSAAAKALNPSASVMDLKSAVVVGGNGPNAGAGAAAAASRIEPKYCKLCIRSFGLMRGKNECSNCRDKVCGDCAGNKIALPNDPKKVKKTVCDACFGELSGMLKGEIVSVQPWTAAAAAQQ